MVSSSEKLQEQRRRKRHMCFQGSQDWHLSMAKSPSRRIIPMQTPGNDNENTSLKLVLFAGYCAAMIGNEHPVPRRVQVGVVWLSAQGC